MDELGAPGAGKVIKNGMIENLLSLTVFGHIHEPQTHSPPTHTLTLFPHLHTLPASLGCQALRPSFWMVDA